MKNEEKINTNRYLVNFVFSLHSFIHQTTSSCIQFTFAQQSVFHLFLRGIFSLHAFFIRPFLCYLDDFGFDAVIYNDLLVACHQIPLYAYLYTNILIHPSHSLHFTKYKFNSFLFHRIFSCFSHSLFHFLLYRCRLLRFIMHRTFYPFCLLYSFSGFLFLFTSVDEMCFDFHMNLKMSCLIRVDIETKVLISIEKIATEH